MNRLASEIVKSVRKVSVLVHHLGRCKRVEDIVKLTVMVVALIAYIVALIGELSKVVESMLPRRKEGIHDGVKYVING